MIGRWCKRRKALSQPVLIGRGLDLVASCAVLKDSSRFPRVPIPERETPGPIPNPAVKPLWADGSVEATPRESR